MAAQADDAQPVHVRVAPAEEDAPQRAGASPKMVEMATPEHGKADAMPVRKGRFELVFTASVHECFFLFCLE